MGSAFLNFSRRATRDTDRMVIRKYHGRTDTRTWVGARDACASKKLRIIGMPTSLVWSHVTQLQSKTDLHLDFIRSKT